MFSFGFYISVEEQFLSFAPVARLKRILPRPRRDAVILGKDWSFGGVSTPPSHFPRFSVTERRKLLALSGPPAENSIGETTLRLRISIFSLLVTLALRPPFARAEVPPLGLPLKNGRVARVSKTKLF